MTRIGTFVLEHNKARRQEIRAIVRNCKHSSPEGYVKSIHPEVWFARLPGEDILIRRVFDCTASEVRVVGGVNFTGRNTIINVRAKEFIQTVDGTEEEEGTAKVPDSGDKESKETAKEHDKPVKEPIPGDEEGSIGPGYTKFMVFCTADIPTNIMDDLIASSSLEWIKDISDRGAFAILTSPDLSCVKKHSTSPMEKFKNPFLDKSVEEIYAIFLTLTNPLDNNPSLWSTSTFIVLDSQTLKDKTCLLASDIDGTLETRRAELTVALFHLIPVEEFHLSLSECGASDELLTEQAGREEREAYNIMVNERKAAKSVAASKNLSWHMNVEIPPKEDITDLDHKSKKHNLEDKSNDDGHKEKRQH